MLPFTGNPLNRHSEKRSDAAWMEAAWQNGVVLPLWRSQVLVRGTTILTAAEIAPEVCEQIAPEALRVFLGVANETAYFAVDLSALEAAPALLAGAGEFRDLRNASLFLRPKQLAILSQAKGMIDWHDRHGFCSRCGAKTEVTDGGTKRVCPLCAAEHFPRTDPAVIMLAVHQEKCLLARNANWSKDFYSCLAGFMEPGESIEEAVRRELFEEAGVVAGKVTYLASQPWPFPAALMMGCFAEVESFETTLDPLEIADAMWLTKDEARALLAGQREGFRGPIPSAIAHHLIKVWAEN